MKKELFNGLSSLQTAAVAAVCFSLTAVSIEAQEAVVEKNAAAPAVKNEKAQPVQNPVKPSAVVKAADVVMGEEENSSRNQLFNREVCPLLDQAAKLSAEKKFEEAYQALSKAKALAEPQRMGYGPYVLAMNKKIDILRDSAQHSWGKKLLSNARKTYLDAITQPKGSASAELLNTVKVEAEAARAVYYSGSADPRAINDSDFASQKKAHPGFDESVNALIADCDKFLKAIEYTEETSLSKIDPDLQIRKDKINVLIRNAETLYQDQRYDKVRENLEKALILDPYNVRAVTLLKKTYHRLYNVAQLRAYNDLLADVAATEWKWNEAALPTVKIVPKDAPKAAVNTGKTTLYEKLHDLTMDNIDFEGANMSIVIKQLNELSKDKDPDGKGVNIVLREPDKYGNLKIDSLSLDNVPLIEVIKYVCQKVGLKFRVEENAVIIGRTEDDNELRFFTVTSGLINRIVTKDGGGDKTEEKSDEFTASGDFGGLKPDELFRSGGKAAKAAMESTSKLDAETMKRFFTERGVPFNEATAIAYDRRSNKLVVNNTPENNRKLEYLLREIDIQTPLVLIESKILEIQTTDMEELGFQWMLTFNPNLYDVNANPSSAWSMQSPIPVSSSTNNKLVNNLNLIPNFGSGDNFNLSLSINAIDRTDRAEILSTPKVIASTGNQAVIRMVQQMYFPDSWSEPELNSSNGSMSDYTPSIPEFGDAQDIGIVFTVTPTVSPNNYTITLQLNPEVKDLTGWTDYSYDLMMGNITAHMPLKEPEISRRALETSVKVYDGETIVLGGMITDKQSVYDNGWPLLSEIPLIGRLFKNEATDSEKNNLIISVTARLMGGDGVPVRSNPANGLPDFQR